MQAKVKAIIVQELHFDEEEHERFKELVYRVQSQAYPTVKDSEFARQIAIAQEDALNAFHHGPN